jgi:Zn-dependent protease with chaperone function
MTNAELAKLGMMNEYRKQAAFLKHLVSHDESGESRLLLERLEQAEKNERCIFMACVLVSVIALFGLAGLAYSAVLLPQFFDSSMHVIIRLFGALGLGSLLCLILFVGLWIRYRMAVNKLHEEGRRLAMRLLETRLAPVARPSRSHDSPDVKVVEKPTDEDFGLGGLRKAS